MAHISSACPALAQTKYLVRRDAVLKVLFFKIICDLGLIDTVPPWYSPIEPQSVYETTEVQAYWDVPVYGGCRELRANRVDPRIVNNREKQVVALEMSCPWVSNRDKRTSEKTMKYAPLQIIIIIIIIIMIINIIIITIIIIIIIIIIIELDD